MESIRKNANNNKVTTGHQQNDQSSKMEGFDTTEAIMPGIIEPDGLLVQSRILNPPAAGQVTVRVEASGISFAEQSMRRGRYYEQPKFPFVPGYDLVGIVVTT